MVGGATYRSFRNISGMPGASAYLVDSILNDQKKMIVCSVEGEYEQNDICIGVPCIIGKNGVEEIIDFDYEKGRFKVQCSCAMN
jgi:malate dehydrogenase